MSRKQLKQMNTSLSCWKVPRKTCTSAVCRGQYCRLILVFPDCYYNLKLGITHYQWCHWGHWAYMHHLWKSVFSLYSNIAYCTYTSSNLADANKAGVFKHTLACKGTEKCFLLQASTEKKYIMPAFFFRSYRPKLFWNDQTTFSHL